MYTDSTRNTCRILTAVLQVAIALSAEATVSAGDKTVTTICFSCFTQEHWQIWTMDLNSAQIRQITHSSQDKREPEWFKDGRRLIYRTSNARLFIVDTYSNKENQILEKFGDIFDPELSSDNRYIVFTRFRLDVMDNSDIWVFDFSEKQIRKLTNESGLQYDPAWAPEASRIAYVSSKGQRGHNIWIMDRFGGNRTPLTHSIYYNVLPDWSPDGKKIVFASNRTGNYDIWVMDSFGKNKKRITTNKGLDTHPVWSPDGEEILFVSNRNGNMQLWIMKSDGSDPRPLDTAKMRCTEPAWGKMGYKISERKVK